MYATGIVPRKPVTGRARIRVHSPRDGVTTILTARAGCVVRAMRTAAPEIQKERIVTTPNKQHGGARKGAGRKPVDTVERCVRLPRDVIQALTEFGHGRLRYGIVYLARMYLSVPRGQDSKKQAANWSRRFPMRSDDVPVQDVVAAILDASDRRNVALFTSMQAHPRLQEAQAFARDGQPEQFFHALPAPLFRFVDGLLQSTLPGKREAHFLLREYSFVKAHFQKVIQDREGVCCSADKSRSILRRLLQYYLTGKEVVFDPKEPFTFGHPETVFTAHEEIVRFFDGLYALYHGDPEPYLKALRDLPEAFQ